MTNVNKDNRVIVIEEQIQKIVLNGASPIQFDVLPKLPTISVLRNNSSDIPQITFSELTTAPNNWNQRIILGLGAFGRVFKGTWQDSSVAVTSYALKKRNQLLTEILRLKVYRHINTIPLLAYNYSSTRKGYLVYKRIPGGSLSSKLKTKKNEEVLSWHQRLKIAKSVARRIHYLHSALRRPLVHRNVKAANILVRTNEEAALGDFALAYNCSRVRTCEKVKEKRVGTFRSLVFNF